MKHLLVDGRNSIYRALFAGAADPVFRKSGFHTVIIFIRFLHHYLRTFRPSEIHVFWDDKPENLWRRKIFSDYKAQRKAEREKRNNFDVDKVMADCVNVAMTLIPEMGIRMYFREAQEADDLIYAFIQTMRDKESATIVSSDSDFVQLEKGSVHVFNPMHTGHRKDFRYPLLMKCLMGDKADNIPGYVGIGPKKAAKLCESNNEMKAFLKVRGIKTLVDNRSLIDLSKCPFVEDNVKYVKTVRALCPAFDGSAIEATAMRLKIRGLIGEFHRFVLPFKNLTRIS
jgi:5'-3' exonuclease